jgi:magnesium transporter
MQASYSILAYNQNEMNFIESRSIDEILAQIRPDRVSWITMSGITLVDDHHAAQALLDRFNLASLPLTTIFGSGPPSLDDDFGDCLVLDYSILLYRPNRGAHARVKSCMVVGPQFLLMFEQTPSGLFEKTRARIVGNHTQTQRFGVDYLLYLLIKTLVLHYWQILGSLSIKFDALEDEVISAPAQERGYDKILNLREEFKPLYGYLASLVDTVNAVQEEDSPLISPETQAALMNLVDHEIKELLETHQHLRTWIMELIEIHRANVNESTNRVMKTLTIISTIFLPLSFIAGVYGMNFDNMPELKFEFGYPAVLAFMLLVAFGIIFVLRHKKWL